MKGPFKYLIIAGGQRPHSKLLRKLAAVCDKIVTVDKGANAAFRAGLKPDLHVGDDDSVSKNILKKIPKSRRKKLSPQKSISDLEFALSCLPPKSLKIITGAHRDKEGRMDHVFINLILALQDSHLYLVDKQMWITGLNPGKFSFSALKGTIFSLVCLEKKKITISGSTYDVKDKVFSVPSLGLSNQVKRNKVHIETRGPALLFVAGDFLDSYLSIAQG